MYLIYNMMCDDKYVYICLLYEYVYPIHQIQITEIYLGRSPSVVLASFSSAVLLLAASVEDTAVVVMF